MRDWQGHGPRVVSAGTATSSGPFPASTLTDGGGWPGANTRREVHTGQRGVPGVSPQGGRDCSGTEGVDSLRGIHSCALRTERLAQKGWWPSWSWLCHLP